MWGSYIGETKRPVDIRIKEHKSKAVSNKSALAAHLRVNHRHKINWQKVQILEKNQHQKKTRKILEAIHIKRNRPKINLDKGVYLAKAYDRILFNV